MIALRGLSVAASSIAITALALACGSFSGASGDTGTDGGGGGVPPGFEAGIADSSSPAPEGGDTGTSLAAPFEIAKNLNDLAGIAATETTVYVLEHTKGNLLSFPIDGGGPTNIETNSGSPFGIAIAGGFLYWSNYGGKQLKRISLSGGGILSVTPGSGLGSFAIVPVGSGLVTAALGESGTAAIEQYGADLSGGFGVNGLANPVGVAVHGSDLYWTESGAARIGHGVYGQLINDTFQATENDCQTIAADDTGVYWVRRGEGLVRGVITGGVGVATLASAEATPLSLASDGAALYWLTNDGKLRRRLHAPAGSPPTTLASNMNTAFAEIRTQAIAFTAKYVVWITNDGKILRLPR